MIYLFLPPTKTPRGKTKRSTLCRLSGAVAHSTRHLLVALGPPATTVAHAGRLCTVEAKDLAIPPLHWTKTAELFNYFNCSKMALTKHPCFLRFRLFFSKILFKERGPKIQVLLTQRPAAIHHLWTTGVAHHQLGPLGPESHPTLWLCEIFVEHAMRLLPQEQSTHLGQVDPQIWQKTKTQPEKPKQPRKLNIKNNKNVHKLGIWLQLSTLKKAVFW